MTYRNQDPSKNRYNIPYSPPKGTTYGEEVKSRPVTRIKEHIPKSLFSKRLRRDLKNIDPPAVYPDINFWDGEGLFIHGEASTGKTVYAAQILVDVHKHLWLNFQNKTLQFTSVPKLFSKLKHSFNDEDEDQYDILEEHNDAWLLVLDDLGVSGKPSDWLLETLYLIINHRYENLLPTIITSNLDLNELSDLYGDVRITSRIDRMSKSFKKPHWDRQ